MEHIGLFLGSFNPIHVGHLIVAEMAMEKCNLNAVWFIVSPQNPAKVKTGELIDENARLQMVKLAAAYNSKFHVSDIEFSMPRPSFTNDTLKVIREKITDKKFSVICGTDTHFKIPRWRNAQNVVDNHEFILYTRPDSKVSGLCTDKGIDKKTTLLRDVPVLEISSTFIRNQIKSGLTLQHLIPEDVKEYIKTNNLYK
jgi:nicotinate-nucleotide adenylyltransferase